MENLKLSFEVILPLFLTMALGYIIKEAKLIDDISLKKINNVTFRVFLPMLMFNNIYHTDLNSSFQPKLMLFAVTCVLLLYALVFIIFCFVEKDNKRRGVLIQASFRSNFILFGLPVVLDLYGQEAMGTTSLLVAVIVPLYNVLSVIILEIFRANKINVKQILKGIATNPLVISSFIGICVLTSGIRFPTVIEDTISDISAIATPLALIILGASINFGEVGKNLKYIFMGVCGKLILAPVFGLSLAVLFGYKGIELAILMSMFASPTAVSSFTMAQQMDSDAELAGQLVVFGTTASIITMFLWIFTFKQLGMI